GSSRNCAQAPASRRGGGALQRQQAAAERLGALWRGGSSSFLDAPLVPIPRRPPKLALLMVVRHAILNARLWSSWLHDAGEQGLRVRILIHTTLGSAEDFPSELRASLVPERVAVERCNALNATMLLIGRALEDPEVTHMMTVSDDSIPVKPLHYIYWRLDRSPQSRLCTDDSWLIPRAETWWLLRRGDAELFHASRNGEFLQTFRDAKVLDCDDENFFYLPLKMRMEQWGNAPEASLLNKCPMYTDWRTGERACKAWADHASLCDCESLGQHVVAAADAGHPASFGDVGGEAFVALLRSPFWFARKVVSHSEAAARAAEEAWAAYRG
ncbi:unnamed protein product, partial [Prorocentrum cordatum]